MYIGLYEVKAKFNFNRFTLQFEKKKLNFITQTKNLVG